MRIDEQRLIDCQDCQKKSYSEFAAEAGVSTPGWKHLVDHAGVVKPCSNHREALK